MQEMKEVQVGSLGQEDPLEEEMTTHCSILAWKIPRTKEHGKLQSMGPLRFRCNWAHVHTTLSKMGVFCLLWLFARVFFWWGRGERRGLVCLLFVFITFATSSGLSQLGIPDYLPSKQPCNVLLITPQRRGLIRQQTQQASCLLTLYLRAARFKLLRVVQSPRHPLLHFAKSINWKCKPSRQEPSDTAWAQLCASCPGSAQPESELDRFIAGITEGHCIGYLADKEIKCWV